MPIFKKNNTSGTKHFLRLLDKLIFGAKMLDLLKMFFANKVDLISKLCTTLKGDSFCGYEPSYVRLERLLKSLNDNVFFVVEYPYVDRHYLNTYSSFFSAKFKKPGTNCIRVHLFDGKVSEDELFNIDQLEDDLLNKKAGLKKKYWGFFIIRPLPLFILGRSLISPKAFKNKNFVCCLTKDRVSLLGNELTVHGFPHIVQDTETHTCAESALWSYIEYFGLKYSHYKSLLPSQINKTLLDNAEHRILPSEGLTKEELAKCLQNNGFECHIYSFNNPLINIGFFRLIRIYIESGIPLLLMLGNNKSGHAVLAIGHEINDSLYSVKDYPWRQRGNSWIDVSFHEKRIVFIDDNMPPYQIAELSQPAKHYPPELQDMVVTSLIAPLPEQVFLSAENAYALMEEVFDIHKIGLNSSADKKWVTRLLLSGSYSFKKFVLKEKVMPPVLRKYLLRLALPKFIWLCEIYRADEFTENGCCSGLLLIDATANKSIASVLWYALDKQLFIHDNVSWNVSSVPIAPFRMGAYKHNLKGTWNEWKS